MLLLSDLSGAVQAWLGPLAHGRDARAPNLGAASWGGGAGEALQSSVHFVFVGLGGEVSTRSCEVD